jgi:hypothetical protein
MNNRRSVGDIDLSRELVLMTVRQLQARRPLQFMSKFDQSLEQREGDGLGPVGGAEFSRRNLRMLINGPFCDVEDLSDLPRRFPVCRPGQYLAFAGGQ